MSDMEQPGAGLDSEQPSPADSEVIDNQNEQELELTEGEEPPEEEDEIEVDGKKFALPKSAAEKLKAERMMQADYTRKTQEVAETRKAVEAEREQIAQQKEVQQQYIKDMAKVEAINDQLALFDKVDWQKLIAENPQEAMLYQQQQRALEQERSKVANELAQKQQQFALEEQQTIAKQAQEAEAFVQREIPGWNAERASKIEAFIRSQGIDPRTNKVVSRAILSTPALMKIFDQAEKFAQLEQKQRAKQPPAAPPAPATRVTAARPAAQRDPAKMSTAEWMAHRNSQLRKR